MNVTPPAGQLKATPVGPPAVESRTSTRPDSAFWLDAIIGAAVIGDLLFFLTGMVLAFYGRLSLNSTVELTALTFPIQQYIGHFIFGSTLFLVLSARMGTYSANNILRIRQIFITEMSTTVLWAACFLFLSLLFSVKPPISRIFVILSAILGLALVLGWRWLLRWIIQTQGISQKLHKRLVIVGWNAE